MPKNKTIFRHPRVSSFSMTQSQLLSEKIEGISPVKPSPTKEERMSEAPKRIWYSKGSYPCATDVGSDRLEGDIAYIRADLIQSLLPYVKHDLTCAWHVGHIDGECTCGLTKVKEELK